MSEKLSKAQAELLEAMRRGVRCHYVAGVDAYYFRTDTMRRCTATAFVLRDKGYARVIDVNGHFRLELIGTSQ